MNELAQTDFNRRLAETCQAKCAACCRQGMVFLPEHEFQVIKRWVAGKSPAEMTEFEERTRSFGSFRLYDQKDRCQFLDQNNLCRLHTQGVKPTECFWWPFHVYAAANGSLEIRLSTACCDAYKHYTPGLAFLDGIEFQAKSIGHSTLRAFRAVYPGSHHLQVMKPLPE